MRYRFDPGVLYTIYGNDLERFVIWRANVGHRTLTVFLGNHAVLKRAVTPYHFPTETSGPSGATTDSVSNEEAVVKRPIILRICLFSGPFRARHYRLNAAMDFSLNPGDTMRIMGTQVQIVADARAFEKLKDDWTALWSRADGQYHESHAFSWLSWQHLAKPQGGALRCILGYSKSKLVMVWPLVLYRRGLWTILKSLGPDSADYSSILIDPQEDAVGLTQLAIRAAMKDCNAAIIRLPYVHTDSKLFRFLSDAKSCTHAEPRRASVARLRDIDDWGSYCASLGTLSGKKPGALERRLSNKGALEARVIAPTDRQTIAELVDWTLEHKRKWAQHAAKQGAWLYSDGYRDFLISILTDQPAQPAALLYLILFDGKTLATTIVGKGQSSVKGLITGFDEAFSKFSPGHLVVEHMVKWAYDHNFNFDFGVGTEPFKAYWSRDNATKYASMEIPVNTWGRLALSGKRLLHANTRNSQFSWLRGGKAMSTRNGNAT
ncbi:GNAT family N-acetyltransferase [Paraburkholderia sp. LEh10]|uniref:GNAT family N-acetyltransferase n=1 Tax=Paraburkholderia sp. LEh10 TaxID=2821353 RepID=UPI001AE28F0B|nr:GNAT family N-acetyltransferase [Paraburkholderia sp. LEh10]MBP0590960.1 GNAT family N-acetyltransferase [Paraburkholderia sp. LEh10]